MNAFGATYLGVLAAGAFFVVVFVLALDMVLAYGRVPVSASLIRMTRDYERATPRRPITVAISAALLLACQAFALSREPPFGGTNGEHIVWALFILAEIAYGLYLWRGTRPRRAV